MSRYNIIRDSTSSGYISIGIPTYNGSERVNWLIQSLFNSGMRDDVVVTILDDGSTKPGEIERLVNIANEKHVRLINHDNNLGITKSWNDLINDSQSMICILLNDDIILTRNWLDNLVYFLENNDCGAASPNLLFCIKEDIPRLLNGELILPRHPVTKMHMPELANQSADESPGVVMCPLGSGFGFKRSVFNDIHGFDERTTMIYNESWFGTAAAAMKLPSYCIPAPKIWHLWSTTFSENPELGPKMIGDREAYISHWGGDFDVTHPKFMHGTMLPRLVKWIGPYGNYCEKELGIQ